MAVLTRQQAFRLQQALNKKKASNRAQKPKNRPSQPQKEREDQDYRNIALSMIENARNGILLNPETGNKESLKGLAQEVVRRVIGKKQEIKWDKKKKKADIGIQDYLAIMFIPITKLTMPNRNFLENNKLQIWALYSSIRTTLEQEFKNNNIFFNIEMLRDTYQDVINISQALLNNTDSLNESMVFIYGYEDDVNKYKYTTGN